MRSRPNLYHATDMHLRRRVRKTTDADITRLRKHLDEHFGADGPPEEKLRGLICCVRRSKQTGYEPQVIAEQAKLTLARVRQILEGDYIRVSWDAIAAVLMVLDARAADITVAGELYEQITSARSRPASRPARLCPQAAEGTDSPTAQVILLPPWTTWRRTVPGTTGFRGFLLALTSTAGKSISDPQSPDQDTPDVLGTSRHNKPDNHDNGPDDTQGNNDDNESHPQDIEAIDPMSAQTVKEFTQALEIFNLTHGERPLREIASHCLDLNAELTAKTGLEIQPYSIGSYSNLLREGKKGKLSKKVLVLSYLAGCGATPEELEHWAKAYIKLRTRIMKSGDQ